MKKLALFILCLPMVLTAKAYKGAEYRTKEAFTYGRFEVRMKSAQREGMLSSFFTYHEITSTADWNEIDIEIMGRYSDDVQFNPITRGQVNHVSHYQTPFNPSLDFHTYAFEWTPTSVAWFVEGVEVHRQTGAHIEGLNLPQKIMMNVWNPTYANWAGTWNENVLPAFAYYDWVSYSSYTPGTGTSGTGNNFTFQWKDDFNSWDQTRWEKATHTFNGNGCDFVQSNAVFKDGTLILCLTKETAVGYVDNTGPSVMAARSERDGILILFSEEVDSVSATKTTNYTVAGKTVSGAVLRSDRKSVFLTMANGDTASIASIIVANIKDTFVPANTAAPKNITVTKAAPLTFPVKINCGGPVYKDYRPDQPWGPTVEYGYMDGTLYTNTATITGTTDPGVFNTELNGAAKYLVRVPNGTYTVILMMADNYFTAAGKRVFSVAVQGKLIEKDIDLYAKVGKGKVYQKVATNVVVTEGVLDVHFMNTVDNAVLNGLQIIPAQSGVNDRSEAMPQSMDVGQNFPNPFNGATIIPVQVTADDHLTIKFYDSLGRNISQLPVGTVAKGYHHFAWDGKDSRGQTVSSGVYYYAVEGAHQRIIRKMLLVQ